MDLFDQHIKKVVEGYEAPFDPKAWERVSREINDVFDQSVKKAVDGHEVAYDSSVWKAVRRQLGSSHTAWKWTAAAVALLATGVVSVLYLQEEEPTVVSDRKQDRVPMATIEEVDPPLREVVRGDDSTANASAADTHRRDERSATTEPVAAPYQRKTPTTAFEGEVSESPSGGERTDVSAVRDSSSLARDGGSTRPLDSIRLYRPREDRPPSAKFTTTVSSPCAGEVVLFTPDTTSPDFIYEWNFGDGTLSNQAVARHVFEEKGLFQVHLSLRRSSTNEVCAHSTLSIVVHGLPKTQFEWKQFGVGIPAVQFADRTDGAVKWEWNIDGLQQSVLPEWDYTFRKAGNYTVELTSENAFGCRQSIRKRIAIEDDYNLLAPTAFSPNGDFKNDYFIPEALKVMDVSFTMNILDRSGQLVYTTQDVNSPWNGRITKDQLLAPDGAVYIWRVVLTNHAGETELYEGQVIVLR